MNATLEFPQPNRINTKKKIGGTEVYQKIYTLFAKKVT